MFSVKSWIPAIAGLALIVGCESKPVDKVPTTPPMAMKEPFEVLRHLQYMAVRKDVKHPGVILVSDPEIMYNSAWWFNKHAGEMGLSLTAEELAGLNAMPLKEMGYLAAGVSRKELQDALDKLTAKQIPELPPIMDNTDIERLDLIPGDPKNPDYAMIKDKHIRHYLAAGLYRAMKGIPTGMWNELVVTKVDPDKSNPKINQVYLGFKGEPVLQVSVIEKADKTLGICYFHFKAMPRKLQAMYDKAHPAK